MVTLQIDAEQLDLVKKILRHSLTNSDLEKVFEIVDRKEYMESPPWLRALYGCNPDYKNDLLDIIGDDIADTLEEGEQHDNIIVQTDAKTA